MSNLQDRVYIATRFSAGIHVLVQKYLKDCTTSNWNAIITEAETFVALHSPDTSASHKRTVSIEVYNGAAVIKYGRDYTHATATTLCRMINSHLASNMTLINILPVPAGRVVHVHFYGHDIEGEDGNGIVWRTYHIDPDGYVTDTTNA